MKWLGSLVFLGLLVFYIAWPGYSGYQIKTALDTGDADRLAAKIDFPSLRASLRPAVAVTVEKMLVDTLKQGGAASGPLTDQLRAKLMPQMIDGVLNVLVTPEQLIRIHSHGGDLKTAIDSVVAERAGEVPGLAGIVLKPAGNATQSTLDSVAQKLGIDTSKIFGGAGQKTDEPAAAPTPALPVSGEMPRQPYGIENIKRFELNGPLGLAVGIAKDPAASQPDLTAEMSLIGGDWKLTGLVPRI